MLIIRSIDQTDAELLLGPEGKNLLSALTAFVAAAVHVPAEPYNKQGRVLHSFRYVLIISATTRGPSNPAWGGSRRKRTAEFAQR